jgi:hypothetical protein
MADNFIITAKLWLFVHVIKLIIKSELPIQLPDLSALEKRLP